MALEQSPKGQDVIGVQLPGSPAHESGWSYGENLSGLPPMLHDEQGVTVTTEQYDTRDLNPYSVPEPSGMAMGVVEQGDGLSGGQDEAGPTGYKTSFSESLTGNRGHTDAAAGGPQAGFDAMSGLNASGEPQYQSFSGVMGEQDTK